MPVAIPQLHDGILYRSRTEARWGEFWSLAQVPVEYEPEGFDLDGEWYVPDFRVGPVYFEVKGAAPTAREWRVARLLAKETCVPVVVAVGNPGFADLHVIKVDGSTTKCTIVEEFRSEQGAWLAEFADGGGWALPLRDGLRNCAATGEGHGCLVEAGRLQFRLPKIGTDGGVAAIGDLVAELMKRLRRGRA